MGARNTIRETMSTWVFSHPGNWEHAYVVFRLLGEF